VKRQKLDEQYQRVSRDGLRFAESYEQDKGWQHEKGWVWRTPWEQLFLDVFGQDWRTLAAQADFEAQRSFFVYEYIEQSGLGGHALRKRREKTKRKTGREAKTTPRPLVEKPVSWDKPVSRSSRDIPLHGQIHCSGDNLAVINWINGCFRVQNLSYQIVVGRVQKQWHEIWNSGRWKPCNAAADWMHHVYREGNSLADEWCTKAIKGRHNVAANRKLTRVLDPRQCRILGSFDGGKRDNHCAASFVVRIEIKPDEWTIWEAGAIYLQRCTVAKMELLGASMLTDVLLQICNAKNDKEVEDAFPDLGVPDIQKNSEDDYVKRRKLW